MDENKKILELIEDIERRRAFVMAELKAIELDEAYINKVLSNEGEDGES